MAIGRPAIGSVLQVSSNPNHEVCSLSGGATGVADWGNGVGVPVDDGEREPLSTDVSSLAGVAAESGRDGGGSAACVRRRVLVIASRFPPVASVGAIRVRKFVKHLRLYGWDAVVLTGAMRTGQAASHDTRRAADHESLADLPGGLPVHRLSPVVDSWPGFATRYFSQRLAQNTGLFGIDQARWAGILKWRLERLHDRLAFPDRGIWRLPSAVKMAMALHRKYKFDAVFSSGMPFSDHLIGLAVQSIVRKPWIADFRDPWVEYIHWQQWQTNWGQRLIRMAESAVVRRAAMVVSVNDHMTNRFKTRYGNRVARKCVTVPNGYDPDDFPRERQVTTSRRSFRLLYAGSLYETRSPRNMLLAFRRFLDEVPGSREHARFDFAGRPGPHVSDLMDPKDGGAVRYLGLLSHGETTRTMVDADVNTIVLPNLPGSENDTTAKLYECVGCGRPILAAVPLGGAAARELEGVDGVRLCDPDDVSGMVTAITELYRDWLRGGPLVSRPETQLRAFTRQHRARQLADYLDIAVEAGKRPRGIAL